jgi:hypothetical protein
VLLYRRSNLKLKPLIAKQDEDAPLPETFVDTEIIEASKYQLLTSHIGNLEDEPPMRACRCWCHI